MSFRRSGGSPVLVDQAVQDRFSADPPRVEVCRGPLGCVRVAARDALEAINNNRVFGGGYADEVGGGGGSGYEGRNGLGPVRRYGYFTIGEGFQVGGGVVKTWDIW